METHSEKTESTIVVFPIIKGMTPKVIEFAGELTGARMQDHERSRSQMGFRAERVWIEPSNEGDLLVFYFEAADIGRSIEAIGESDDLHDVWFREKMYALTGADLCDVRQLNPASLLFDSPVSPKGGTAASVAVLPILPGRLDELKAWLKDLSGLRGENYLDFLQRFGLSRQRFYFRPGAEVPPPREVAGLHIPEPAEDHPLTRDVVVLYVEGDNPNGAIAEFARSSQPFDAWMREELLYFCGVDFIRRSTAPPARSLVDWTSARRAEAA